MREAIFTAYLILAAVFAVSYVIGSLNSAIITVYLIKHKDIRDYGSKNAGLTNVYRCFGGSTAAATLLMDIAKAAIVVYGTKAAAGFSALENLAIDEISLCMISALCAVVGHCFPAFYNFHGGKGILLAAMCMVFIDPIIFVLEAALFVTMVAATKYISVGSLSACIGYPVFTFIWQNLVNRYFGGGYENIWLHMLIIFPMFVICFFRHFSNIQNLWQGTERRFELGKRSGKK